MKVTKYQHACFIVEEAGTTLVVDPGNLSDDFVVPENVVAVVITHEHPDHFDMQKLQAIHDKNPDMEIIAHESITQKVEGIATRSVAVGDSVSAGPFTLEFFGGQHQLIHRDYPVVANLGVMINNTLYYPGDSYALPDRPVDTLAVPTSGPWLMLGDVADFLKAVHPRLAFSTHDAHSSEKGKALVDYMLPAIVGETDIVYQRLSEPLEL